MKPKLVLGLIGTIGSGKDVVGDYLVKEYGFQSISMGDLVREATEEQGLELKRENLQKVSKSFTDKHGMYYWGDKVCDKILKLNWEKSIINGVRRVQELEIYRKRFGPIFHLVSVDADPKIRFDRLKGRGRVGFPNTWEKFRKHEKGELKLYETFEEALSLAEFKIRNEGTLEELYQKADDVLKKLKQ